MPAGIGDADDERTDLSFPARAAVRSAELSVSSGWLIAIESLAIAFLNVRCRIPCVSAAVLTVALSTVIDDPPEPLTAWE